MIVKNIGILISFGVDRKEKSTKMILSDIWHRCCASSSIPEDIANKWLNLIMDRYYDHETRHYHNDKLLILRINLLEPNAASHLVFAIYFQYYEFDVTDYSFGESCDAFNKFYMESGINDVSVTQTLILNLS